MVIAELLVLSVGLSMDACAVAICRGACMRQRDMRQSSIIALSFGFFQGLMPLIGWLLGSQLTHYINRFDHWVAFGLLAFIGIKMVWDALHDNEELVCTPLTARELLVLSVATSIDALAAGVALAMLDVDILSSVTTIALVTATLSFAAVALGVRFGERYKSKAQLAGGITLCLIGIKILVDHISTGI